MIEMQAKAECDRCGVCVVMENVESEHEAENRLTVDGVWCRSDDGELVCPACWSEFDAKQAMATLRSLDAVDPVGEAPAAASDPARKGMCETCGSHFCVYQGTHP